MGVWIRLNDPRHEPVSESGRAWGAAKENFAISLQALSLGTVSVLIKNLGPVDKTASIPGWLAFYRVSIYGPEGALASLKNYGREVLRDAQTVARAERLFPAGKSLATEIPIAALYDLHAEQYRVSVSCPIPGSLGDAVLSSNEIVVTC
jgi:hypothetical protein